MTKKKTVGTPIPKDRPFYVSHTALEVFRRSPALFRLTYVDRTYARPGDSDALRLGSAVHASLFEPAVFAAIWAVAPEKWDRRTKVGAAAATAWFAALAHADHYLYPDEAAEVRAIQAAAQAHGAAAELLARPGLCEQRLIWTDPTTDLPCKAKIDKLIEVGQGYVVLDAKTCQDESPVAFAKDAARYGYHRQAALYAEAVLAVAARPGMGAGDVMVLFLAVSKPGGDGRPPAAELYELGPDEMLLGHTQNARDRADLKAALDFDCWEKPGAGTVRRLTYPRWAFFE